MKKIKRTSDKLVSKGKNLESVESRKSRMGKLKGKGKNQIHFYMLKKNNLTGDNFVISSIEQNFLLKHIVLFSIVKNNLYYRLQKINFTFTKKDVNIRGELV